MSVDEGFVLAGRRTIPYELVEWIEACGMATLLCMHMSLLLIPPSTASSLSLWPESFSIASRMAFVWKHVASSVARAMWPCFVCAVMPNIVPLAESIQYGAKSPVNKSQ